MRSAERPSFRGPHFCVRPPERGRRRAGLPLQVTFKDVPADARADVQLLAQLGVMQGYSTGYFQAEATAQRGQVAMVMSRFLDLSTY